MSGAGTARPLALGPDMTAQRLLRRSRRLLWLTLLPMVALVLALAAGQAWLHWRNALSDTLAEARNRRLAFELVARDARHHVADLRHWMQTELLRDDGTAAPALVDALKPRRDDGGRPDGHTLDSLTPLLANGTAQLIWPQSERPPERVLRQLQALSAAIELAHQRHPDFVWSYFFGWPDRHLVLFPWVASRTVAEDMGAPSASAMLADWYGYEVVQRSLPANNPLRQPYWTAPYIDAGGKGLMVSHAVPVYSADELRGTVGTDIRLASLERLLDALPGAPWQAWVLDEDGRVLGDRQRPVADAAAAAPSSSASGGSSAASSAASTAATAATLAPPAASAPAATVASAAVAAPGSAPSASSVATTTAPPGDGIARAAERLPPGLDVPALLRAAAAAEPVSVAGQRVVALRIDGAPWVLVLAAPAWGLARATLPEVLPYFAIVLGLLGMWLLAQGLLRRRLLEPVLQLLGYLQRLSEDDQAAAPALGARWRPWIARVRATFDDLRRAALGEQRADLLKSAIIDHAQDAVLVTDREGRIVEFNPAAETLLGRPRDDAIGHDLRELFAAGDERAEVDAAMDALQRGASTPLGDRRLPRRVQRADGHALPVLMQMWLTQVEGERYYTVTLSDQTAARAAAEVIERQRDALRQSEKLGAMGSLLAGVAHELNNPLAIVMGRAGLLQEKTEGTPLAADAARIHDAAERCARIVRTFLNMARQRPAQRGPVPLNDLARAAADMLGYTLRSHGIVLEMKLDAALPELQADGDQLGQVLLNLIVNAQQALAAQPPPRRIVVSSGTVADGGAPQRVWMRVADSGPGVPAQVREQLFEPFFTTKAEGLGTGIGLSVSRAIVRDHGGDLMLEPAAPGHGASFLLTLPLVASPRPGDDATPDADATPGPATLATPATPEPLVTALEPPAPPRVLVVDDESEVAELVRAVLEGAGVEVSTADSGAVALALLDVASFDAVVSDLRMPGLDGAGLWRALRDRAPALSRRVVFLTGDTLSAASRQFLDETGCGHLDKPFVPAELLALVRRALNRNDDDA